MNRSYAFWFLLLFLGLLQPLLAGDDASWSKPDNQLRGRLLILPGEKPNDRFCRVFIELQNVADVIGQREIRFSPGKLKLQVTDKDGRALEVSHGPYDGMSPIWKPTLLPFAGTIKFQISFPGLGYRKGEAGVIVDMGAENSWVVPPTGDYFLSGTFTVRPEEGDHPFMNWSGTLTLPKVAIPKPR